MSVTPPLSARPDVADPSVNSLVSAAVHFELEAVVEAVRRSVADHGVVWTWERLIYPVWSGLGGGRDVSDGPIVAERLFTGAMTEVLASTPRPLRRTPIQVLLACSDEEHHTLSMDALAAALAESGVTTCVLGARVPPNATAAAVGRLHPAVVVIWSQVRDTADARQITSLLTECPGSAVITAGPGWNPAALPVQAATSPSVLAALTRTAALLDGTAHSVA